MRVDKSSNARSKSREIMLEKEFPDMLANMNNLGVGAGQVRQVCIQEQEGESIDRRSSGGTRIYTCIFKCCIPPSRLISHPLRDLSSGVPYSRLAKDIFIPAFKS